MTARATDAGGRDDGGRPPGPPGGRSGAAPASRLARIKRLALLAVAAELVVFGLLWLYAGRLPWRAGPLATIGTELNGRSAPDFRLTDADGGGISLADLRGRVVVLTFLYTTCPDTCPLIASKLGQAHDRLGQRAREAAFVAISVDPERDTAARAGQYLDAQRLGGKLAFLTGDRPSLEGVWAGYGIGVRQVPIRAASGAEAYEVAHNDVLYLIDRQGRLRRLLRQDVDLNNLIASMDALLREPVAGLP
jgi:protein SCO1